MLQRHAEGTTLPDHGRVGVDARLDAAARTRPARVRMVVGSVSPPAPQGQGEVGVGAWVKRVPSACHRPPRSVANTTPADEAGVVVGHEQPVAEYPLEALDQPFGVRSYEREVGGSGPCADQRMRQQGTCRCLSFADEGGVLGIGVRLHHPRCWFQGRCVLFSIGPVVVVSGSGAGRVSVSERSSTAPVEGACSSRASVSSVPCCTSSARSR